MSIQSFQKSFPIEVWCLCLATLHLVSRVATEIGLVIDANPGKQICYEHTNDEDKDDK